MHSVCHTNSNAHGLVRSEKFGFIFVVTKMGLLFVYDLENLTAIYRQRISADPVFLAQGAPSTGGVYVINRRGAVLHVTVNPETMVPFISQSLKNVDLAIKVATRGQLPGAEGLFLQQFERQFSTGLHREAAETAANAPGGVLRTQVRSVYMFLVYCECCCSKGWLPRSRRAARRSCFCNSLRSST